MNDVRVVRGSLVHRVTGGVLRRMRPAGRVLSGVWPFTTGDAKAVLFLVGSQRSGTNMVLRVLTTDPETCGYNEDAPAAFCGFRLRSDRVIRLVIRASAGSTVVFKPLCDAQWTDRLLAAYPGSRAIWIFRHYNDVANSAVKRWHEGERAPIRRIHAGAFGELGWIGERLSPSNIALVRAVYRDDISLHECGVLVWYLRNSLFFEQGLETHPRVRLVKYEDLVMTPAVHLPWLCKFAGTRYTLASPVIVNPSSIGREAPPALDPQIRALADGMLRRLERACVERSCAARRKEVG